MNFDQQTPVDILLGKLLAFVIMFEKKIEQIRCKLAGNQDFHTRLAFQHLDYHKKNQITTENLFKALNDVGLFQNQSDCQFFIGRYSRRGVLTYEEFLKLVTPKCNKTLTQRMMVRTFKRGINLEAYLYKKLLELLSLYVKMSVMTQTIRRLIQSNQDLSQVDLFEFFHQRIGSPNQLIAFLNRCSRESQDGEYDVEISDAIYLSNHIQSGNDLTEFTDLDIQDLISPIDVRNKKTVSYTTFFQKTIPVKEQSFNETKMTNFLGKTYQKIYKQSENTIKPSQIKKQNYPSFMNKNINQSERVVFEDQSQRFGFNPTSVVDNSYGNLYIDNFARSGIRSVTSPGYGNTQRGSEIEVFHDDLKSNASSRFSKDSAFDRN